MKPTAQFVSAKLLVMTGRPFENGTKTEVIDLLDPTNHCVSIDFPVGLTDAHGGLLGTDLPFICGGEFGDDVSQAQCYGLRSRNFVPITKLEVATQEMGYGSVVINGSLIITGGYTTGLSRQVYRVSVEGVKDYLPELPVWLSCKL